MAPGRKDADVGHASGGPDRGCPLADDPAGVGEEPLAGPAERPSLLVVEDEPETARLLAESLADDYRVAIAADGRDALAKVEALRPDVVITDLVMPHMDGEELVVELRRHGECDEIAVVVLSASSDEDARVRLLRAGAQDYLTKPVAVEELRVRVSNLVARKHAAEAARHAEARFRGILSSVADALLTVDARQVITEWNAGAETMFGYARSEAIGAPLEMLLPERQRVAHREHVRRFASSAARVAVMDRRRAFGRRKDGRELPVAVSISKLEVGLETTFTVVVRDVSEQRRLEDAQRLLAESASALCSLDHERGLQHLVESVVRSLSDLAYVFLLDDDGRLSPVAAASRDLAHARRVSEVLSASFERLPGHPASRAAEERRPVLRALTPDAYEVLAGSAAHLDVLRAARPRWKIAVPLLVGDRCLGVLSASSATRELGPAEAGLLEEIGRRCAVFLENVRLHRAEKRATQARDEVLGVVAHDLRGPLNAIALQAGLLSRLSGSEHERARKAASEIMRAVGRMGRLVDDLVDVARLEVGELDVAPASLSPEALVAEVVELHRVEVSSGLRQFACELSPGLPEVWADRDRLLQVFQNLVMNALKFTPRGRISIGARPSGDEVLFWVSDTGSGIAVEDIPHVFERFWRAAGAARGGRGLGLPIVKTIVHAHGGRVWVESRLGIGSTFYVTMPVVPRAARSVSAATAV